MESCFSDAEDLACSHTESGILESTRLESIENGDSDDVSGVTNALERLKSPSKSCGLTPVVSKASAGTMESKIVYSTLSLEKMLKTCQKEGWQVVGTMQSDDETPAPSKAILSSHNISITKPTILVMGNEGYGLSSSIIPFCNKFITISPSENACPVGLDSLNVSVATGILLHSLTKQRCSGSILT